jgi:superfamily I DNA and/or RNA helicase
VSTSTGASDPRLLAACGITDDPEDTTDTIGRIGSGGDLTRKNFDRLGVAPDGLPPLSLPFVIVDESCQATEPASIIPITSTNSCRSLVLLGDPLQLPPTVRSADKVSPLSISLMSRLAATLPPPVEAAQSRKSKNFSTQYLTSLPIKQARSHFFSTGPKQVEPYRSRYDGAMLLSIQYRMHPSISAFPSAIFYDGLLATPGFLSDARKFPRVLRNSMPCNDKGMCVRMVDVGGRNNERLGALKGYSKAVIGSQSALLTASEQTSYWNGQEAAKVVSIIKEIVTAAVGDPSSPRSIGVVTPYKAQVDHIRQELAKDADLMSGLDLLSIEVEVKTVDGFQGRERDLIVFSAVRSNRKGDIGFLRDWRRLNTALTRAKSGLIVIGDLETLEDGDKHWAAFAKWCKSVPCLVEK